MPEPVPPSEVTAALCAGRCRRVTPHRVLSRHPEVWSLRCLACNRAERQWVTHARSGELTSCGLPARPPLRLAEAAASVSCPACQQSGLRSLGVEFKPGWVHCAVGCKEGRLAHAGELWTDLAGDQLARLTCSGCGVATFWGGTHHRPSETGLPRCSAPTRPYYRSVVHKSVPRAEACRRCAELEAASRVLPDWRPLAAIPEDYYAA